MTHPTLATPAPTPDLRAPSRSTPARWALASLSLSVLLSSLGTSIANIALPTLTQAFGASFQQVQWVVLAYLLAITTLIVSAGRLGDLIGRRRLLLAGIVIFTGASVLSALAPTLWLLVAARAAQGLGAAAMMALTMAFVADAVPREATGRAMGLLGTMSAVGTALGPSLGGVLISALGWRAIFWINLPLGVIAFVLARRYLPVGAQTPGHRRVGFDMPGTVVLALTLAAYALAMTISRGSYGALNAALLLAVVLGVVVFVKVERKAQAPLIRLGMFRDPMLGASLATSVLVMTVMMATLVVGPFYLSRALGLEAAMVGLAVSVGPVVAALMGVPAGRLVDRFGAQAMSMTGLGGVVAGCALLASLPISLGVAGYVMPLALVTSGFSLFQTANNTAVMAGVAPDQRGVVSGMLNLARNLGLITGAAVMGAVFAMASGAVDLAGASAAEVAVGMRTTFVVGGICIVCAAAVSSRCQMLAGRFGQRNTQPS